MNKENQRQRSMDEILKEKHKKLGVEEYKKEKAKQIGALLLAGGIFAVGALGTKTIIDKTNPKPVFSVEEHSYTFKSGEGIDDAVITIKGHEKVNMGTLREEVMELNKPELTDGVQDEEIIDRVPNTVEIAKP
jgi:hypothetical protein